MPDLNGLKRYAVASTDTDEVTLQLCMDAAVKWFENAGVPHLPDNPLYDLGVYQLATHYFDNRGVIAEGSAAQLPLGIFAIMHQLRSGSV